uniref:Cyclic phosphodiesterase n=1 Tax=Physcomitrium patens TaxID=3218 RepID=A0A7I4DPV3_PHYPA
MAGEDAKKVSKKADDKDDREKEAAPSPPPPAPSPPPPKPGYFSVWAEPAHYDSTLHLIMTQLMEQHEGPAFLPHVTIMSHHWSSPEEAEASLKALCDCTLPFTLKVLRVESGTTYHQCIYLLMDKTQEVVKAHVEALECFKQLKEDSNLEEITESEPLLFAVSYFFCKRQAEDMSCLFLGSLHGFCVFHLFVKLWHWILQLFSGLVMYFSYEWNCEHANYSVIST